MDAMEEKIFLITGNWSCFDELRCECFQSLWRNLLHPEIRDNLFTGNPNTGSKKLGAINKLLPLWINNCSKKVNGKFCLAMAGQSVDNARLLR